MKNRILITALVVALGAAFLSVRGVSVAQEKKERMHRIVFEVNVDGQEAWGGILNNVENVQKAFGREHTQIEVVAHGKGLSLLLAADEPLKERLSKISESGVVLAACENTMRRKNVKKEDLLPFATTVPSGVAEVVLKQEAGWAYLKGGS